jgi:predicted metal-binding protein
MREHAAPKRHLLVCANRRDASSPLGTGCAERGDAVYDGLKKWVAERGLYAQVWVTKTHCLGICPKSGCTIAVYPDGKIISEVSLEDAIDELG